MHYFQFDPSDWCDVLMMENKDAGKRFKELILRLSKFEAPEGSIEAAMIAHVIERSEKQRQKVMARWNRQEPQQPPPPPPEPEPPKASPPAKLPPPRIPRPKRKEPPEMSDVYDWCDANKVPPPIGREWYDYQESKGWNTLKMSWQSALRGFCKKKIQPKQ